MHKENKSNQGRQQKQKVHFTFIFFSLVIKSKKGQNRGFNQTFANCTIKARCASD